MRCTARFLLVSLPIFFFSLGVVQQSYSQERFGLKGGVHASKLGKVDRFSWRPSYYVGGYGHVILSTKAFLQPELLYLSDAYTDNNNSSPLRRDINFKYISIPILFGYKLSKNLSAVIGPEVSCLLNARVNNNQKQNVTNTYSKFTYGVGAGLNYQINNRLGLDFRYTHSINGLRQYYTDGTDNVSGYNTFNRRVLQLGLSCNL